MFKKVIIGAIVALALPLVAGAATDIKNLTFNGSPNITGGRGEFATARLSVELTADSDVESVSYDYTGDDLDRVCVDTEDQIQSGWRTFDVDLNLPQDTGTWDIVVRTFGVDGAGTNQDCQDGSTDVMTFFDRVTVTSGGSGGGNGGTGGNNDSAQPSYVTQLLALIEDLRKQIADLMKPAPTPVPTPVPVQCEVQILASGLYIGATDATTGGKVTRTQMYLINHGFTISAIQYGGASYGYWGNQSATALVQALAACN